MKTTWPLLIIVASLATPCFATADSEIDSPGIEAEFALEPETQNLSREAAEVGVADDYSEPVHWDRAENASERNLAPVVIIVNKAKRGATAQRMIVYKDGDEIYRLKVSSGRERHEVAKSGRRYFTASPGPGYYQPTRITTRHFSNTWKTELKWVVFFNGGVAIHATSPDHYAELGSRASGGCIRLHADHAKTVFDLIRDAGTSENAPVINNRRLVYGSDGEVRRQLGPNTLIIMRDIQD
jgi:hypothetical protein